jgi:decaprenyl-phosphate phosphoribosyltransferase
VRATTCVSRPRQPVEIVPWPTQNRRGGLGPGGCCHAVVVALRPLEWVKNLFVLAPLLFCAQLDNASALRVVAATLIAFCAVSGAGYLINDSLDVEFDRRHPLKRNRPTASSDLPVPTAIAIAVVLP